MSKFVKVIDFTRAYSLQKQGATKDFRERLRREKVDAEIANRRLVKLDYREVELRLLARRQQFEEC